MIPHYKGTVPYISTSEMIEVDRIMIEEYSIDLTRMMENAGINLAILVNRLYLRSNPLGKKVVVVAGSGGNGGGALVAARRLHNWGADVSIVLSSKPEKFKKVTRQQYEILMKMGITRADSIDNDADVIIDGLIGYSIKENPAGRAKELIEDINSSGIPVVSLDTPSGLNLMDGVPGDPTVKAKATLTLALPKIGLFKHKASKYVGNIYLADISVPPELYKKIGIDDNSVRKIFSADTVVKINKVIVFSK
jgi:NAD(P)H-hydrate epimerase